MGLKYAILASLASGEHTGYDLSKKFQNSIGFFWTVTHQQIYQTLKVIEEDRLIVHTLIAQSDKPDKKIYAITKAGLTDLKNWIETSTTTGIFRDEFLVKLFAGHVLDNQAAIKLLLKERSVHAQLLSSYLAMEENYLTKGYSKNRKTEFQYFTLLRGISSERSWLTWCDDVLRRLRKSTRAGKGRKPKNPDIDRSVQSMH